VRGPKTFRRLAAAGCALSAAAGLAGVAGASSHGDPPARAVERVRAAGATVPGEALVRYRPGASAQARARARDAAGAVSARGLALARTEVLRLAAGRSAAAAIAALERRPEVEFAQPNHRYRLEAAPNDPLFAQQYALHNIGQSGGTPDADIDAPEAWDVSIGSDSVVIGVIDSGVNLNHPDLAGNLDSRGRDFVNDDAEVSDDFLRHGTFVAGVAAARGGNGQGMSGVAQRAKILPLQAEEGGVIPTDAVVDAVGYAKSAGARIVNMSFGSFGVPDPGDNAIRAAIEAAPEILFVASAGNEHPTTGEANDNDVVAHWPSNLSVDHANVIAVASTTRTDALSESSSYGGDTVSLAAPGESVIGADGMSIVLAQSFDGVTAPALPTGWSGSWATTSERRASLPNSLTDSPGASYSPNANAAATSPSPAVPQPVSACTLAYAQRVRLALGEDAMRTSLVVNGTPLQVAEVKGSTDEAALIDVRVSGASSLGVELRLQSDATLQDDGVHVDNLELVCNHPSASAFSFGTGTSFSAPAVAGAAAVLLGRNPDLTPAQLKSTLMSTVDPLPSLSGKVVSGGRVNLDRAVRAVPAPAAVVTTAGPAPTQPQPPPIAAAPDRRAPEVARATVRPATLRPLRSGAMVSATRRGASLRFVVDEPSRVRVRVLQARPGRRAGRRCVAPTRRNLRARRCTRVVELGSTLLRGTLSGSVRRRFSGRAGGRALRPGLYRLEVSATDAAGNRSRPRLAPFRIVAR
jgi:subtilisin family serine protease